MSAEEKLCIKVLRILQEMLIRTLDFDEKVSLAAHESNENISEAPGELLPPETCFDTFIFALII